MSVARAIIPDVVIIDVVSSHPVRYVNMLRHHYIGIMNVSMRFHQGFSAKSIGYNMTYIGAFMQSTQINTNSHRIATIAFCKEILIYYIKHKETLIIS